MRLVGISGAQGAGKTTLLNELKAEQWLVDDFKVSRAVQKALGWDSLDQAISTPANIIKFHDEIFAQKYLNDYKLFKSEGDEIVLTERTFADLASYAITWTLPYLEGDKECEDPSSLLKWVVAYRKLCTSAQKEIYSGVILIPLMGCIEFEEDKNRATEDTAEKVFETIERFTQGPDLISVRSLTITAESVRDRAKQVSSFLRSL